MSNREREFASATGIDWNFDDSEDELIDEPIVETIRRIGNTDLLSVSAFAVRVVMEGFNQQDIEKAVKMLNLYQKETQKNVTAKVLQVVGDEVSSIIDQNLSESELRALYKSKDVITETDADIIADLLATQDMTFGLYDPKTKSLMGGCGKYVYEDYLADGGQELSFFERDEIQNAGILNMIENAVKGGTVTNSLTAALKAPTRCIKSLVSIEKHIVKEADKLEEDILMGMAGYKTKRMFPVEVIPLSSGAIIEPLTFSYALSKIENELIGPYSKKANPLYVEFGSLKVHMEHTYERKGDMPPLLIVSQDGYGSVGSSFLNDRVREAYIKRVPYDDFEEIYEDDDDLMQLQVSRKPVMLSERLGRPIAKAKWMKRLTGEEMERSDLIGRVSVSDFRTMVESSNKGTAKFDVNRVLRENIFLMVDPSSMTILVVPVKLVKKDSPLRQGIHTPGAWVLTRGIGKGYLDFFCSLYNSVLLKDMLRGRTYPEPDTFDEVWNAIPNKKKPVRRKANAETFVGFFADALREARGCYIIRASPKIRTKTAEDYADKDHWNVSYNTKELDLDDEFDELLGNSFLDEGEGVDDIIGLPDFEEEDTGKSHVTDRDETLNLNGD